MSACRCPSGSVLVDRGKATVECACGRCTPRRLAAVEAETARLVRTLLALALALGVTLPDEPTPGGKP